MSTCFSQVSMSAARTCPRRSSSWSRPPGKCFGRIDGDKSVTTAGEDSVQRIEVFLGDWVELVIVTTSAGNRQALERLRKHVDLVVDNLDLIVESIHGHVSVLDHAQVASAQYRFVELLLLVDPRVFKEVPCQVFQQHSVVGNVRVEGADEVVTITPCHRQTKVALAAVGLAVAHPVHPEPRPVLAEALGVQEPVHHVFVCFGRSGMRKRLDLLRPGGQPREVETEASHQRSPVSLWSGPQAGLFQLGEDEGVDLVENPSLVAHRRGSIRSHRSERPMGTGSLCGPGFVHRSWLGRRPRRPDFDPFREVSDLVIRQLTPQGHLDLLVSQCLDQDARIGIARDDRRPTTPANEDCLSRIETQAALLHRRTMAAPALLRQHRSYPALEELRRSIRGCLRHGRTGKE